tara:strand:+ start:393 stop:1535 length:1143 start_codon:yes stop_codon:yes gene_type:complete
MTILPLLLLALSPIQIDGEFNDWEEGVTNAKDSHYLYQRISLRKKGCLQQLSKEKIVSIGDYSVHFSPKDKGHGVSCSKDGQWISPYDIGLVFAPTTASKDFEIRIDKPDTEKPVTDFDLGKTGNFRVVSWNVQFGNLLDKSQLGTRLLKSLQPDVLLLQELDGTDSPETLSTFLHDALGNTWNVVMSEVSGTKRHHQLRSAIATPFPLKELDIKKKGTLKAVRANADIDGTKIQFLSLHLRCCGGPTGDAEEQRQLEAKIIRRASKSSTSKASIIAGDWNLVGTDKPLEIVKSKDFTIVEAFQPDGVLNATWSNTSSPFTPGRLDWMIFNGKVIELKTSFILDSSDLDEETRNKYKLRLNDTAELSDHLPLVADFTIIK